MKGENEMCKTGWERGLGQGKGGVIRHLSHSVFTCFAFDFPLSEIDVLSASLFSLDTMVWAG